MLQDGVEFDIRAFVSYRSNVCVDWQSAPSLVLLPHFSHRLRSSLQVRVQDLLLTRRVDKIRGFLVARHVDLCLVRGDGRGVCPSRLALGVSDEHWADHSSVVDGRPLAA